MTQFERYTLWKNSLLNKEKERHESLQAADAFLDQGSYSNKWKKLLYWEPQTDSWAHEFFGSSVIHGLKYLSKRKLSLFERAFWVFAFVASFIAAMYLILQVWERFHRSPVIVSFKPTEEEIYRLPFPAVTICNKSLFSKDKIMKLINQVDNGVRKNETIEKIRLVHAICTSRQSFLRRMNLVRPEEYPGWDDVNKPPSSYTLSGVVKFIYENTQPCSQLLRVCSWNNVKRNCSELFKPIITDSGKCCVFNKLPNELMLFEQDEIPGAEKREHGWSYDDILAWKKWNYEEGYLLGENMKFPLRQKQAGNTYGLSVLVDPDVDNGYCQSQDSLGVRLLLHTPTDSPRIAYMGTGFGLEREIFIKITPDLTVAEQSILDYDYKKRKCIFGKGLTLEENNKTIDKPYTRNNCYSTCTHRHMRENCNCTLYYARRKLGYRVCNPSINSPDFRCLRRIEDKLAGNLRKHCPNCIYGCHYLKYTAEHTEASLLDPADLWGDNETNQPPPWSDHQLSILHLFMGADTQVVKLRQKLYHPVDLIASIGGLLGLFMGFSVLSAIEILYLLTIRLGCKRYRKWQMENNSPEAFLQLHLK